MGQHIIRRGLGAICLLVVAVALGVAVTYAGGNGDGGAGNKTTPWTTPMAVDGNAACIWTHSIVPAVPENPAPDNPNPSECQQMGYVEDSYAHAIADGMQIWGYSWAKDECGWCNTTGAASSASSTGGRATITAVYIPPGCSSLIRCDWMPRFKLRVEFTDADGVHTAAGYMKGDCSALPVHLLIKGGLEAWAGEYGGGGDEITLGPVTIPLSWSGESPDEITPSDYQWAEATLPTETAYWSCSAKVRSAACACGFDNYAEGQAFIWDSKPGLDLHANCPPNCTGYHYVVYGWYQQ